MERETTKVLFPRFQREIGGELEFIAEPRNWLAEHDIELISHPAYSYRQKLSRQHSDTNPNWWGHRHYVTEYQPLGLVSEMPKGLPFYDDPIKSRPNGESLFMARILKHEYQWDQQTLPGRATEVILERMADVKGLWAPLMAVLVDDESRAAGMQRLVTVKKDGVLDEPRFKGYFSDRKLTFYMNVLRTIAHQTLETYGSESELAKVSKI